MTVYDDYRKHQDELLKVQREARKAMEGLRAELAIAGVQREILVWKEVAAVMAKEPVDMERLIDLLLAAETLEQAKKKSFYL